MSRRGAKTWGCTGAALGIILLSAVPIPAQWFRLGQWDGELQGVFEYSRQDSKTAGQPGSRSEDFRGEERLTLRNSGAFILDPRLFTLTVGGTFGLSQERLSFDGTSDTRQGTLWGYDLFAGVLPEAPYSLNVFANREPSVETLIFGGRATTDRENRGATLFAKRLYIPSSLSFRQEIQSQDTQVGNIVSRRDERRNIVTYQGARGWENAEGSLGYEFTDLSDRIFPDLSYQSHEGNVYYSRDFGTELNWHWDSRGRIFTRTGTTELTTATVDETLRIDHTDRLQTTYRYALLWIDTAGGGTTTHAGTIGLHHRLYESLTTDARIETTLSSVPGGHRNSYGGRLDLAYQKRIPLDGLLRIGLGGGLEYDDNQFETPETFVPQETHTFATPIALPVALNNPFVIVGSVVVTKTAVGPLPAGCVAPAGPPTPLVLNRDYTLRTIGNITEIVPIPCAGATPGINPGDTIAVDYRFIVPTSLAFTTTRWRADLSVDYGWIRPYYIHEQTDQSRVSGQDGQFLDSPRSDTAGMELRYNGQRVHASVLGEVQRFSSSRIAYDSVRSSQFVIFPIFQDLTLTLSGDQAWFDYSLPSRQTRTLSGRVTLSYAFNASLFADAFASLQHLKDTLVPTERTLEAGLRVRWFFRRIEVNPTFEFFDRRRGDTDTKDYRVLFIFTRRF